ncbi:sigma-70 family RNA polymerase sigma factor [Marinivivus vitaminiproducens]|uniref:sigma-70 family RNA polymerase sigma factor n=1 Tax=Marinivivus vitaminiproducens TaxID=3035935 RepID=UPI0027A2AE5E|nr:sigma-70 family RNA polymerase sigma factor [Geminicoccaceae bacterium SCSIO 64248]
MQSRVEHESLNYADALRACARGEKAGLRRIYEHDANRLFAAVLRIVRHRAVAEDVLHDVFIRIWEKADQFDPARGNGRAWIYTVARSIALNSLRNDRRLTAVDEGVIEQLPDHSDDPQASLLRLDESSALRRCLEALEPNRRRCILLAFQDGCTHNQVAERLEVPLGTAKAWIRRGLLALRECLG